MAINLLYVNIYKVGRFCAGPEEGGDWRDCGTPIGAIPVELTPDEFEAMRDDAIEKGVLVYREDDDTFTHAPVTDDHEHSDWCRPDEHDIAYLGEEIPERSVRCHENAWRKHMEQALRDKANDVALPWRKMYQSTGKRGSVLGGEDYDVVIEKHWPEPFPKTVEPYS